MRGVLPLVILAAASACSFHGHAKGDDVPTGDDDVMVSIDAAIDGSTTVVPDTSPPPAPINLAAPANGGVLAEITSVYCPGPNDCQTDRWSASNLTDGVLGAGTTYVAANAIWASKDKHGMTTPEHFTFTFAQARAALVTSIRVQNFAEAESGATFWSTHFKLYSVDGSNTTMIMESDLAKTEASVQEFALPAPTLTKSIEFEITAASSGTYWELGELEIWGTLQ